MNRLPPHFMIPHDSDRRQAAFGLFACAVAAVWPRLAGAQISAPVGDGKVGETAWVPAARSAVRLLAGEREADGNYRAGLEIRLDPGFHTYWRTPGESGLPPVFDWSASDNLAAAEVSWPAPSRFRDPTGFYLGYKGGVLLPILIRPERPDAPVKLNLALDFGVCATICIPARAALSLDMPISGAGLHARSLALARARVPALRPLGAPGALSLLTVMAGRTGDRPGLTVRLRAGGEADLFAEGPDGWLFGAPQPEGDLANDTQEGRQVFVPVLDAPRGEAGTEPLPVRLTLVAGADAIETQVRLDAGALRP